MVSIPRHTRWLRGKGCPWVPTGTIMGACKRDWNLGSMDLVFFGGVKKGHLFWRLLSFILS